ncbi:MAG TPA: GTPase HflX [Firmicutes bacterium]|nr:GTPase HflX [Candidatus Fermentithermobacillaceae bacterium]
MNKLAKPENIRAIICAIDNRAAKAKHRDEISLTAAESAGELVRLAETLGMEVAETIIQDRPSPDPATYLGKGKVQEVAELVADYEVSYVLIDGQLSPTQSNNLEEALGANVLDRTQVILGIFAQRAKTKEGKLQVELATRRHELTRLTGHGTAMSSLGAGIGTRGPGEQKLEIDRRVLRKRISQLTRDIDKVRRVREEQRKRRRDSQIPQVSLVGYTNAGKSTLFKALTGEQVLCDDMLFATLDPWTRKWVLPSGKVALLSDTVGFIQGLPHDLVFAFRSTLEESLEADLLVHVVDISSPTWIQQVKTVDDVLEELGASQLPTITVLNKADKVLYQDMDTLAGIRGKALGISALKGYGLDDLAVLVEEQLVAHTQVVSLSIPYSMWDVLSEIRDAGSILEEVHEESGARITCRLDPVDIDRFRKKLSG